MATVFLNVPKSTEGELNTLEQEILRELEAEAVISLDKLIEALPQYTWNQIFNAVDRLARVRKVVLRRHRFDYTLFSTNYAA